MASKANGVTFISALTSVEGDILLERAALVAGKIKGNVRSSGLVNIELGGLIEGELTCDELRVSGVFRGKVHSNKVVIVSSGVLEGEVASQAFEIYEGGQFIGQRAKGAEVQVTSQQASPKATYHASQSHLQNDGFSPQKNSLYAADIENETTAKNPWLYVAAAAILLVLSLGLASSQVPSQLISEFLSKEPVPASSVLLVETGQATPQEESIFTRLAHWFNQDETIVHSELSLSDDNALNSAELTAQQPDNSALALAQADESRTSQALSVNPLGANETLDGGQEDQLQMDRAHVELMPEQHAEANVPLSSEFSTIPVAPTIDVNFVADKVLAE